MARHLEEVSLPLLVEKKTALAITDLVTCSSLPEVQAQALTSPKK
jgi:hypothetical protein